MDKISDKSTPEPVIGPQGEWFIKGEIWDWACYLFPDDEVPDCKNSRRQLSSEAMQDLREEMKYNGPWELLPASRWEELKVKVNDVTYAVSHSQILLAGAEAEESRSW